MGWRDIKAKARAVTHTTFKVACLYIDRDAFPLDSNSASNSGDVTYPQLDIRVHENQTKLGDQAGTSLNSAERFEAIPQVIFWRADLLAIPLKLKRGSILSVAAGEAYRIDVVEPNDQETIKCRITRLSANEAAGLPLPEA